MTSNPEKCSKCGGQLREDRHLQVLNSEVELVEKEAFLGDKLRAFYCEQCGYVELYREKKQ